MIDKRLQDKLRKETDTVRRAEEAKKEKHSANRKEEEIQLKNSIVGPSCVSLSVSESNQTLDDQHRLRRARLPILANFLLTSDVIPSDDSSPTPSPKLALEPTRSHPPPLYFLPVVLTTAQEAFIVKRKAEVTHPLHYPYYSNFDHENVHLGNRNCQEGMGHLSQRARCGHYRDQRT